MEALLRWRHLAPTAPDTLPAIPLSEADPFIMTVSPAVFFVGCQPSYGTRLVSGAAPLTVFDDLTSCAASWSATTLVDSSLCFVMQKPCKPPDFSC